MLGGQRPQQRQTIRLRRCRPLGQQLRLLAATGGNEVVRLRGLRPPWQQGQQ
ncbi:hypothetical protein IDF47_13160 [Klebsiella pneumoniae]|nr:hypothetical protein [Klebsiella pneumoniae]